MSIKSNSAILPPDDGKVPLRGLRAALLLVDLQNDFCHVDGVFSRNAGMRIDGVAELVEKVNRLAAAARAGGALVIWIRMVWRSRKEVGLLGRRELLADEGLRAGTWGAELLDDLDARGEDLFLKKTRFSAFYNTELESLLEAREVGRLVVAGVRTDYCVESTVRDAFFRDYDVAVVRDGVAGYFATLHENSLTEMQTVFAELVDTEEAVGRLRAG